MFYLLVITLRLCSSLITVVSIKTITCKVIIASITVIIGNTVGSRATVIREPADLSLYLLLSSGCVFSPIFPAVRVETQFSDFLDGLGPAQLVGRQTLATPAIGELDHDFNIHSKICLCLKTFMLQVFFLLLFFYPFTTE